MEEAKKEGGNQNDLFSTPTSNNGETNNLYDKKFEDIEHEVAQIKDKIPDVRLMEDQLENMKREFTALKGELMTFGNKSNKSIRR